MEFWNRFAAKHPETAKWVREGKPPIKEAEEVRTQVMI